MNQDHSKKTGHDFSVKTFGQQHAPVVNYINITRNSEGGITNVELKRTVTKVITFPHTTSAITSNALNKNLIFENCNDTSPSGYSSPGSNSSLFANDSKLIYPSNNSINNNVLLTSSTDKFAQPISFLNVNTLPSSPQSSISSLSEESKNSSHSVHSQQTIPGCKVVLPFNYSNDDYLKNTVFPGLVRVSSSKSANSGVMTNITVTPRPSNQLQVVRNLPAGVSFTVSKQIVPHNSEDFQQVPVGGGGAGPPGYFGLSDIQQSVDALTLQVEEEMKLMSDQIQRRISRQRSPPPYYGVHLTNVDSSGAASSKFGKLSKTDLQLQSGNNNHSKSLALRNDASQTFDVESQVSFGSCPICKHIIVDLSTACRAMGQVYHSQCFVCNSCGRKLKDRPFYNVSGKVYCEEDYLYSGFQQTTEKCSTCGHFIIETILQALGKSYHPGCFRCSTCNQCLDGEPFTVDVLDRILCINDYNNIYAPKCAACGLSIAPVQGNEVCVRILSMDKDFHVECYKCKDCQVQLSDEDGHLCYPLNDALLCKECHTKRVS